MIIKKSKLHSFGFIWFSCDNSSFYRVVQLGLGQVCDTFPRLENLTPKGPIQIPVA